MKYTLLYILVLVVALYSCSDMNELHDKYMEQGEIDYVGRIDSVYTYSGNGRIKFRFWITDPRASELHISWKQQQDTTVVIPITEHIATDELEFILGDNNELIEKSHGFKMFTQDADGVKSVKFEIIGTVLGQRYINGLTNRRLSSKSATEQNLSLTFGSSLNDTEVGVRINWTNTAGELRSERFDKEQLSEAIDINDVDFEQEITYQSVYLPVEAIDEFFANSSIIEI